MSTQRRQDMVKYHDAIDASASVNGKTIKAGSAKLMTVQARGTTGSEAGALVLQTSIDEVNWINAVGLGTATVSISGTTEVCFHISGNAAPFLRVNHVAGGTGTVTVDVSACDYD